MSNPLEPTAPIIGLRQWRILDGDAASVLRDFRAESVQTCVTSPPYFNLRNYDHPGQMGQESTPDEYVAALVDVFREVRRVLKDDGTVWLNLGDTYANASIKSGRNGDAKVKDLIGIPWMVAFALRADGWYLRQDIIWHKLNPIPESAKDRCTRAHEYLFLLSKSKKYLYNADAIVEPAKWERWGNQTEKKTHQGTAKHLGGKTLDELPIKDTKNKRTVWSIPTKPYPGAHCAPFPPKLVEPCILAGSNPGNVVLDPFAGSGTAGLVALDNGRSFVGIELNPDYALMARERIVALDLDGKTALATADAPPAPADLHTGPKADKPNHPQTPTPKVEDSVVEVGE